MSEVKVELVKYDTIKTKKRKRANFIVSEKTEQAVIEKLEKIHKGDKVKSISELIWGEDVLKEEKVKTIESGIVKFFDQEKGFGFINSNLTNEDLFFHASALGGEVLYDNDPVEFEVSLGPKGPIAIHIKLLIESVVEDEEKEK